MPTDGLLLGVLINDLVPGLTTSVLKDEVAALIALNELKAKETHSRLLQPNGRVGVALRELITELLPKIDIGVTGEEVPAREEVPA